MNLEVNQDARRRYTDGLRAALFGPLLGPDEVLKMPPGGTPQDVYLTGIIYPMFAKMDQLSEEDDEREQDAQEETDPGVSLQSSHRPSSMGISFRVRILGSSPSLHIKLTGGRYNRINSEDGQDHWKRTPVEETYTLPLSSGAIPSINTLNWVLRVRQTDHEDERHVTIALTHSDKIKRAQFEQLNVLALFQSCFEVTAGADCALIPQRISTLRGRNGDRIASAMLYREREAWAIGHMCSASWSQQEPRRIWAEWLPEQHVPSMRSGGAPQFVEEAQAWMARTERGDPLNAHVLSTLAPDELCEALSVIPIVYERWLEHQELKVPSLGEDFQAISQEHLSKAQAAHGRIKQGVETLRHHASAREAFQLAQRAIALQSQWRGGTQATFIWRPFQLAFQLLTLTGLVDGPTGEEPTHEDRDVMDLLWFPTGGGKTEAYLAITALAIFWRRLREQGDSYGSGVTVLMRYTLRLLTLQQFERAARLILACEHLRRGQPERLGEEPIGLGLWVGSGTTPNKVSDARQAYRENRARLLTRCPACNEDLLHWDARPNSLDIEVECTNTRCAMSKEHGVLPIYTIDEMVYRRRPSLVIGTVDKFAQIVRQPDARHIFGGVTAAPPELIIQDELHLISGPLGSIVGLYECAIELICTEPHSKRRPKVIGSTATIRSAQAQVKALFDRDLCQFPAPVLDADDSCFAQVDHEAPGRLYLGVTSAGRSPKHALRTICGALYQNASQHEPLLADDERDPYWTMIAYFNTLRELGGALVMMHDDIRATAEGIAQLRGTAARQDMSLLEMSSRVDAATIPHYINRLEQRWPKQDLDALLCTNMISVGVDIGRLGLMVINGQPKSMSEYIQASARVGRGQVAGLIVTSLNARRARDRSHYESFRSWHQSLYASVEPTSVTPFAPRARDKALHAVIVALARIALPRQDPRFKQLADTPALDDDAYQALLEFVALLATRAEAIDQDDQDTIAADVRREGAAFLDQWRVSSSTMYWNDLKPMSSFLISAEEAVTREQEGDHTPHKAMNSMREVEPSTDFKLSETTQVRAPRRKVIR